MAIQHRDIPEAELHEPKGVSLASAGTVYVANGQGSGEWGKINTDNIEGLGSQQGTEGLIPLSDGQGGFTYAPGSAYGSLVINNNSTEFPITVSTDLNNDSSYKIISGTGAPWTAELTYETAVTGDGVSPAHDGIYKVETYLSISQYPSTSAELAVKYVVNENQFRIRKFSSKSNSGGDAGTIYGFDLVQLAAGDVVRLAVASTVAGNITFETGNLTLTLVRAL